MVSRIIFEEQEFDKGSLSHLASRAEDEGSLKDHKCHKISTLDTTSMVSPFAVLLTQHPHMAGEEWRAQIFAKSHGLLVLISKTGFS